jgi:ssDNA-binding Zn-finger/Zn-ribbon topoisomerase 1
MSNVVASLRGMIAVSLTGLVLLSVAIGESRWGWFATVGTIAVLFAALGVWSVQQELTRGWCPDCGARLVQFPPVWTGPWWEPRRFVEPRCLECHPLSPDATPSDSPTKAAVAAAEISPPETSPGAATTNPSEVIVACPGCGQKNRVTSDKPSSLAVCRTCRVRLFRQS